MTMKWMNMLKSLFTMKEKKYSSLSFDLTPQWHGMFIKIGIFCHWSLFCLIIEPNYLLVKNSMWTYFSFFLPENEILFLLCDPQKADRSNFYIFDTVFLGHTQNLLKQPIFDRKLVQSKYNHYKCIENR